MVITGHSSGVFRLILPDLGLFSNVIMTPCYSDRALRPMSVQYHTSNHFGKYQGSKSGYKKFLYNMQSRLAESRKYGHSGHCETVFLLTLTINYYGGTSTTSWNEEIAIPIHSFSLFDVIVFIIIMARSIPLQKRIIQSPS